MFEKKSMFFRDLKLQIDDYILCYVPETKKYILVKVDNMSSHDITMETILPEAEKEFKFNTYEMSDQLEVDVIYIIDDEDAAIKMYHQKTNEDKFDL